MYRPSFVVPQPPWKGRVSLCLFFMSQSQSSARKSPEPVHRSMTWVMKVSAASGLLCVLFVRELNVVCCSVLQILESIIHQSVEDESGNGLLDKMTDAGINTRFLRIVTALVDDNFDVSPSSQHVHLPPMTGENSFYKLVGFGKCVDTHGRPVCVYARKGLGVFLVICLCLILQSTTPTTPVPSIGRLITGN